MPLSGVPTVRAGPRGPQQKRQESGGALSCASNVGIERGSRKLRFGGNKPQRGAAEGPEARGGFLGASGREYLRANLPRAPLREPPRPPPLRVAVSQVWHQTPSEANFTTC